MRCRKGGGGVKEAKVVEGNEAGSKRRTEHEKEKKRALPTRKNAKDQAEEGRRIDDAGLAADTGI
jgi:hypothetical protein